MRAKSPRPRAKIITIKLTPSEAEYIAAAAAHEPMGPISMGGFFRGAGMQRTAQLVGITFADFQAAESAKGKR